MLHFLFEMFIAKYAPISSGIFGILGSIALAIPPIESGNIRTVLLKLEGLKESATDTSIGDAKRTLTQEARRLIDKERFFNLAGAALLVLSFAILSANAIYSA